MKDDVKSVPPRGRPRLGVVSREVTLLPRHWEWLATQSGGASATLRRLVDAARRENADIDRANAARDAAYRYMSAVAGDLPRFEEALRALYRGNEANFRAIVREWPDGIGVEAARLAFTTASPDERNA